VKKDNSIVTQIRIGNDLGEYLYGESKRLNISLNAMMIVLMEDGRKLRNVEITPIPCYLRIPDTQDTHRCETQ
jgi:hypothetical protein